MQTCRTLGFTILFYSWTTILGVVSLPLLLAPRRLLLVYSRFWIRSTLVILRLTVGITHQVRGEHHVPQGPVIFAIKHQSAWDTLVINLLVEDPAIILKKELLHIPIFGWCLRHERHIAVDRSAGTAALKQMVAQAQARSGEGRSIVIYPEGTRTAPGTRRPYHVGVAALYNALDLPVVPVALNSGLFWPRRSLRMRPGTITVEYLPPIAPGGKRRDFMTALEGSIETAAERLHDEVVERFNS